jgi:hypothetical protein
MEAPKRANVRRDKEEPMWTKSKTDSEDPRRATPYTDKALPNRMKLRKDRDADT